MKITLDTLDDRRTIWHLLHRLPPSARVRFLRWACSQVPGIRGNRPLPQPMPDQVRDAVRCGRGDDRLTNAVYMDVLILSAQWALDLEAAARQLEHWVKKGPPSATPSTVAPAASRSPGSTGSARLLTTPTSRTG
jgi:hypothetical protein